MIVIEDKQFLWRLYCRHLRLVIGLTVTAALLGAGFAFTLYQPLYRSEAKLILHEMDPVTVVSQDGGGPPQLRALSERISPVSTQLEVLRSEDFINTVIATVRRQLPKGAFAGQSDADLREILLKGVNIENIVGTDVIAIEADWHDPVVAQKIAQAYVGCYRQAFDKAYKEPLAEQEAQLSQHLRESERELTQLNHDIELFQTRNHIFDAPTETQLLVSQMLTLESQSLAVARDMQAKRREAGALRGQLRVPNTRAALNHVAEGHNLVLQGLRQKLQEAEAQYRVNAIKLAPTHPTLLALQETMDALNRQINDETTLTIGYSPTSAGFNDARKGSGLIGDAVRADLVGRLAGREAEYHSLLPVYAGIQREVAALRSKLLERPAKQIELARLTLQRQNHEEILVALQKKLTELKILRTRPTSAVQVVQAPNLPEKPRFPNRWHLVGMVTVLAFSLASAAVIGFQNFLYAGLRPEFLENTLGIPVFTTLPWMPTARWRRRQRKNHWISNGATLFPELTTAYQTLALMLRAKQQTEKAQIILVGSTAPDNQSAEVIANLGSCLAQGGQRVMVLDANLRAPVVHEAFHGVLDYDTGLPELINDVADATAHGRSPRSVLDNYILASGIHTELDFLQSGTAMEETYAFLNAPGMGILLQTLRERYDWILINAPSLSRYPDAYVLLKDVDGLLLLIDHVCLPEQIAAIQRQIQQVGGRLLGCVLRPPERMKL
jgi:uncharacterized protein involved in exopolysaccharide biosynthesis/Mrp family chromosome partitioning ATPase